MVTPKPSKRTANNTARGNRAMPQNNPLTMTDPHSIRSTINEVSRGTSTDVPAELTWDRARDHISPMYSPDKNRYTYSVDEMHHISSGGPVDHSTKLPTNHNSGNRW
jgi:hypothetical protein